MAWYSEPKNDFGVEAIPTTYYNDVADNLIALHSGNGHDALTSIAANVDHELDIGAVDAAFNVNDETNYISYISTTGRQPGNIITLINTSGQILSLVVSGPAAAAGYASVKLTTGGLGNYSMDTDYAAVQLIYSGTYWLVLITDNRGA